jgi:hypothetical protein
MQNETNIEAQQAESITPETTANAVTCASCTGTGRGPLNGVNVTTCDTCKGTGKSN